MTYLTTIFKYLTTYSLYLTTFGLLFSCTTAKRTVAPVKTITTLNGSKSHDKSGKIVAYEWKQLEGQKAMIYNNKSVITKVELPRTGKYIFELWGKNDKGLTGLDTTIVRVKKL